VQYANFESLMGIYWIAAPARPISQSQRSGLRGLSLKFRLDPFRAANCDTGASTMQHQLTRARLRSRRRRGVEFRSKRSPRDVLMNLPLRTLADNIQVGVAGITAIHDSELVMVDVS
jgi:hypothetical protein